MLVMGVLLGEDLSRGRRAGMADRSGLSFLARSAVDDYQDWEVTRDIMAISTSGVPAPARPAGQQGAARERVLDAAYDLFAQRGIRDVGINELIAKSGVAKATFYRYFPSKDDVVLAFLQRREAVWTIGLVATGAAHRASSPEGQLLAIFDVFEEWFKRDDFEGCAFVKVLVEVGPDHHLGKACIACLDRIRAHLTSLAEQAGLDDSEGFSRSLMILIKGCILSILEGDEMSAERAKRMTRRLIEDHRPTAAQAHPGLDEDRGRFGLPEQ